MRLDSDIKRDVEDELSWDADLDAIDIGVTAHNGVLTLGGFVASFAQKSQAKRVDSGSQVQPARCNGVLGPADH